MLCAFHSPIPDGLNLKCSNCGLTWVPEASKRDTYTKAESDERHQWVVDRLAALKEWALTHKEKESS